MQIKDRLALNFTLISTGMLFFVLCSVYFIFLKFLEADFYARLNDRTMVTARLYLEADEISSDELKKVRGQYLDKLSDEVIRIYDTNNKSTFIGDSAQYWTTTTIEKVRTAGKLQFKDGKHQVVGIFYKDNQGDFVILASATDQSSHYRLAKLFKIMLVAFILMSIILLSSGRWLAKKILRPLQYFIDDVKKIGSTNLEFRVQETDTKDEINLLAKSFNQLIAELEQAFILQKTFVASASHELRTPLTRVIMSAELALAKERQVSAYQEALTSVLEDTSQIESIITGLLTLANMDIEMASSQLKPLPIMELILAIKEEEQKQHQHHINLILDELNEEPMVLADQVLLQIAIKNIVSNAFKFSNNQAIDMVLKTTDQKIILSIIDYGSGIAHDDLSAIFKPFYSRSEQIGKRGEGMGLYLAFKIISLFKGTIEAQSTLGKGSTFMVTLPNFNPVLISV